MPILTIALKVEFIPKKQNISHTNLSRKKSDKKIQKTLRISPTCENLKELNVISIP
jgi:hypothetical protein